MKAKYLIMVSLILAIMTIGAASAADNVTSDDSLAADNGDVQEVLQDESTPMTKDDFDVEVEESIAVNSTDPAIYICVNEHDEEMDPDTVLGNITVNVDDGATPIYNENIMPYDDLDITLSDLNITTLGTHRIIANFIPVAGDAIELIDTTMNVTQAEGHEDFDVTIHNGAVNFPDEDYPFIEINTDYDYGNILIYLDDVEYYNKTVVPNDDWIYVSDLNRTPNMGKYLVKVKYDNGTDVILLKSAVREIYYNLDIEVGIVALGKENTATIQMPDDVDGDLYVTFNGKTEKVPYDPVKEPGYAYYRIPVESLKLNEKYIIKVELRNDSFYPDKSSEDYFTLIPYIIYPEYMSTAETDYVSINLPSEYTGILKLYNTIETLDEREKGDLNSSANLVNGKASIPLSNLGTGSHYFIAQYDDGKDPYEEGVLLYVYNNNENIAVSVTPSSAEPGENVTVNVTGPQNLNQAIHVYVDGVLVKRVWMNESGKTSIAIPSLAIGDHLIKVLTPDEYDEFESRDLFYSNTFSVTVNKANSTLSISDVSMDYGESANVTATAEGAIGVTAKIDGKNATVVNNYTIVISGLDAGTYTLTVTTIPDENHNSVTRNATITVNKLKTELAASAVTTTYNINKDLVITLKDANGNPLTGANVTVDLNGAKTYVTDKNGQITVETKGLAVKAYTAKIAFAGNAIYAKSAKDVKVTVKKATPKLIAKNKKFKVKKAKKYAVTLKDNTGKAMQKVQLTIKVGKKTFKAKTNAKGKATFNLKKLSKKGKYKATVTYKGNNNYNKATKKVKITIK